MQVLLRRAEARGWPAEHAVRGLKLAFDLAIVPGVTSSARISAIVDNDAMLARSCPARLREPDPAPAEYPVLVALDPLRS